MGCTRQGLFQRVRPLDIPDHTISLCHAGVLGERDRPLDRRWRAVEEASCAVSPGIASHSREQDFYFGPDYLLRRHDYRVEASGGFAAAQYVYEPRTVQGITLPIRRRAYMRDKENRAMREKVMVSIDISEVAFL